MRWCLILILVFVFQLSLSAQVNIYENFSLQRDGNNVYISWSIVEGQTCNGIIIERSTDSINFKTIHDIQGVCGSVNKKVNYNYTDTTPVLDKTNYYRLILGVQGRSEIGKIKMPSAKGQDILIYPLPLNTNDKVNMIFKTPQYEKLKIYNLKGVLQKSLQLPKAKKIAFNVNLPSGMYLFNFTSTKGNIIVEKVIINTPF